MLFLPQVCLSTCGSYPKPVLPAITSHYSCFSPPNTANSSPSGLLNPDSTASFIQPGPKVQARVTLSWTKIQTPAVSLSSYYGRGTVQGPLTNRAPPPPPLHPTPPQHIHKKHRRS